MSVDALFNTTMALRRRLIEATLEGGNPVGIHVGSPLASEVGDSAISLTLVDVQPSAALRNAPRIAAAPSTGPVTGPGATVEAIALELRYLIVCHRKRAVGNESGTFPTELSTLGRIIAALHADAVLSVAAVTDADANPDQQEAALAEQLVRLSLEPYGLDGWNRLWALFPETAFRTSIAYVAAPVYVSAGGSRLHPRVQSRRFGGGVLPEPTNLAGAGAA